jgi:hypothetical protein
MFFQHQYLFTLSYQHDLVNNFFPIEIFNLFFILF